MIAHRTHHPYKKSSFGMKTKPHTPVYIAVSTGNQKEAKHVVVAMDDNQEIALVSPDTPV